MEIDTGATFSLIDPSALPTDIELHPISRSFDGVLPGVLQVNLFAQDIPVHLNGVELLASFYVADLNGRKGIIGRDLLQRCGISITGLSFHDPTRTLEEIPVVESPSLPLELPVEQDLLSSILDALEQPLASNFETRDNLCHSPDAILKFELIPDAQPVARRQYPIPQQRLAAVRDQIETWLREGVIELAPRIVLGTVHS